MHPSNPVRQLERRCAGGRRPKRARKFDRRPSIHGGRRLVVRGFCASEGVPAWPPLWSVFQGWPPGGMPKRAGWQERRWRSGGPCSVARRMASKAQVAFAKGRHENGSPVLSVAAVRNPPPRTPGLGIETVPGRGDPPERPVEVTVDDPGVSLLAHAHYRAIDRGARLAGIAQGDLGELAACDFELSEKNRFLGIDPGVVAMPAIVEPVLLLAPLGRDPEPIALGGCGDGGPASYLGLWAIANSLTRPCSFTLARFKLNPLPRELS